MSQSTILGPVFFLITLFVSIEVQASDQETARVFAKASVLIFNGDFTWESPEREFTEFELAILGENLEAVDEMICAALNVGNSVVGAELMAHFEAKRCLLLLRSRFLRPGTYYGWEGGDSGDLGHLSDRHYVYHSRYIEALQAMFPNQNLVVALSFTDREIDRLKTIASSDNSRHRGWAQWMIHRLML